jgi:hypothetical protein
MDHGRFKIHILDAVIYDGNTLEDPPVLPADEPQIFPESHPVVIE